MKKMVVKDKYGNPYTLEYTRETVMQMERSGFNIADAESKPMTTIRGLFEGAFLANHKAMKPTTIEEIFEGLTNKSALFEKLAEMYTEPYESLMDEPEQGNATWEINW